MTDKETVKITEVQIESHWGGWILIHHKYGAEYLKLDFVSRCSKFKKYKSLESLTRKLKKEWRGKEIVLIHENRYGHYTTSLSFDSVYELLI